jgi:hypothetical protein
MNNRCEIRSWAADTIKSWDVAGSLAGLLLEKG